MKAERKAPHPQNKSTAVGEKRPRDNGSEYCLNNWSFFIESEASLILGTIEYVILLGNKASREPIV